MGLNVFFDSVILSLPQPCVLPASMCLHTGVCLPQPGSGTLGITQEPGPQPPSKNKHWGARQTHQKAETAGNAVCYRPPPPRRRYRGAARALPTKGSAGAAAPEASPAGPSGAAAPRPGLPRFPAAPRAQPRGRCRRRRWSRRRRRRRRGGGGGSGYQPTAPGRPPWPGALRRCRAGAASGAGPGRGRGWARARLGPRLPLRGRAGRGSGGSRRSARGAAPGRAAGPRRAAGE